jgi:hypothetical protein
MDMSWSTHTYTLSLSSRLALIFSITYVVWFATLGWPSRRQKGSLMMMLFPPLVLSAAGTWIGLARVTQTVSRFGGSRGSIAAALAETLLLPSFGAVLTAICALIALVAMARTRYDAIGTYPRGPIVIAMLCWLTSGAALLMPSFLFPTGGGFAIWNASLAASFFCLVLLVPLAVVATLAHRHTVQRKHQLTALAITLAIALIQAAVAWKLIDHYRLIAMGIR